jgi:cellulose synthase/poly-beta-1,6-N-acetylglucosamine synthase-like glycosyltransferase
MGEEQLSLAAIENDQGWRWLERDNVSVLPTENRIGEQKTDIQSAAPTQDVSVFIIARNELSELPYIVDKLLSELRTLKLSFELLFVDTGFFPNTHDYLAGLSVQIPLKIITPKRANGNLSLEEIRNAIGSRIIIFDADLHCTSSAIPELLLGLEKHDIVIAKPGLRNMPWYRGVQSACGSFLRAPLFLVLGTLPVNGLRGYRSSALQTIERSPLFREQRPAEAQLLLLAHHLGLSIGRMEAEMYSEIFSGWTRHVIGKYIDTTWEVVSFRQHNSSRFLFPFLYPPTKQEYTAAGFTNVTDYLFLSDHESAKMHVTKETFSLAIVCAIGGSLGLWGTSIVSGWSMLQLIFFALSLMYLTIIISKIWAMILGAHYPYVHCSPEEIGSLSPAELPVITVLIPLYKEREIIPQLFRRISEFDYPVEKLDIIFILESTDQETISAFLTAQPPAHFKALLSPNVTPKTKPKALNVAFTKSKGEILVIFDAEILPDVDQLKKAYITFKQHPEAKYLHGRMNVYNADFNWITHLYDAEFAYFYDYYLPGIVRMGVPIPLSGHSTYFRREVIEKVGGWDSYNIAEDCDIGIRIYRHGFKSGMMLDSFSWEQSTTTIPRWLRQRTRWEQGFIQTSLVHLRFPLLLKTELGSWRNFFWFLYLVPGNVILNILHIFHWGLFFLWIFTHAAFIEFLFPLSTIYFSMLTFIGGNYVLLMFHMLGLYSRRHYTGVKYALGSLVYWIMLGLATFRAAILFFFRPFSWDKTPHLSSNPQTAILPKPSLS